MGELVVELALAAVRLVPPAVAAIRAGRGQRREAWREARERQRVELALRRYRAARRKAAAVKAKAAKTGR